MGTDRTKSMRLLALFIILLVSDAAVAQFPNVKIGDQGYACEPSIMIDPNNPARVMAASVLNNYYYSADTGRTWTPALLNSKWGVWGDPVLDIDEQGSFYFFHLSNYKKGSWIDRIVCQRTDDNGLTWPVDTFTGLNDTKAQDKHWTVIDRKSGTIHMTWTQFDVYDSHDPKDRSNIMYAQSKDRGETWSEPLVISTTTGDCVDDDETVEGATPAIGPNGEIYVSWSGPEGLVFKSSLDNGLSWQDDEIRVSDLPGGWAFDIPGIFRCNGMPVTKCDLSGGENHGTIYINWSDQLNGEDDTDIWLTKSTDGGQTWTDRIKVNEAKENSQQFFTWMDIDQTTGYLYFIYYDRDEESQKTRVKLSLSKDGGQHFFHFLVSDSEFLPTKEVFFGDYNNISAHDGIVRPIWTEMENKKLSVWTALIDSDLSDKCVLQTEEKQLLTFNLIKPSTVKFYWGDMKRKRFKKKFPAGEHHIPLPQGKFDFGEMKYAVKVKRRVITEGVYYINN